MVHPCVLSLCVCLPLSPPLVPPLSVPHVMPPVPHAVLTVPLSPAGAAMQLTSLTMLCCAVPEPPTLCQVSAEGEVRLYSECVKAGITMLSIGHRPAIKRFHSQVGAAANACLPPSSRPLLGPPASCSSSFLWARRALQHLPHDAESKPGASCLRARGVQRRGWCSPGPEATPTPPHVAGRRWCTSRGWAAARAGGWRSCASATERGCWAAVRPVPPPPRTGPWGALARQQAQTAWTACRAPAAAARQRGPGQGQRCGGGRSCAGVCMCGTEGTLRLTD